MCFISNSEVAFSKNISNQWCQSLLHNVICVIFQICIDTVSTQFPSFQGVCYPLNTGTHTRAHTRTMILWFASNDAFLCMCLLAVCIPSSANCLIEQFEQFFLSDCMSFSNQCVFCLFMIINSIWVKYIPTLSSLTSAGLFLPHHSLKL